MPGLTKLERIIVSCRRCPRLTAFRENVDRRKGAAFRGEKYWGHPVPGFGDRSGRLLIVGLAPAAHGGNRTGRMFTGDGAAGTLMRAMHAAGFAGKPVNLRRGDGLRLRDAYITAVVKCAPPDSQPTPAEKRRCAGFLVQELKSLPSVRVLLALGRTAFESVLPLLADSRDTLAARLPPRRGLPAFRLRPPPLRFVPPQPPNTSTGPLTPAMLSAVFGRIRAHLAKAGGARE